MNFWLIHYLAILHLNFAMNLSVSVYEFYNLTENSKCLTGYISTIIEEVQPYTTILDLSTFNNSNDDVASSIVQRSSYIVRRNKKPAVNQLAFSTLFILWHNSEGCPSTQDTEILSNKIKDLNYERSRAPLILILQSKLICTKMADLLRKLQGPRAYRLVILTLTLVNGCQVSLHTYDHFTRTYSSFSEINNITVFPNKIRKLNGFKLKVAAVNNPPYVYLDRDKTTGQACNIDGPDIQIINIISKQLDLDIEFMPRFNEFFNEKSSNGKPIGVVVELFEHNHDLTVNSIYIHTYNEQFLRFAEMTRPYNSATLSVMILSNGAVSVVNSFVGVKELTIVCCCLLAAVWFGLSVVPRDHPARGILKTLGSFLGSGVSLYPKWWSAKLFLMSFTVLFAIMSTDLQSLLTSSLIYEIVPNDIKTLRELERNGYSLLLGEGHYNMCFSRNHDQNNHSNYYIRLQARAGILEDKQLCVQRLLEGGKNGKIGCVVETYIGFWFIKKFSELVIVEETLLTHWKGFVFFKGYFALPMVNKVLSILTESGITNKIIGDYVGVKRKVIPKNVTYRLTLKNFYNTIYVIVILYAISIIVFLIEILLGRYKKM